MECERAETCTASCGAAATVSMSRRLFGLTGRISLAALGVQISAGPGGVSGLSSAGSEQMCLHSIRKSRDED